MNVTKKLNIHRPEGFSGKGDKYLFSLIDDVAGIINKQNELFDDLLYLSEEWVGKLAVMVLEFAEDLHNDIGIWKSYENYNKKYFGTPFPLTVKSGVNLKVKKFDVLRFKHFLWNIYSAIDPEIIIPPHCFEIDCLSEDFSLFFAEKFSNIPCDSGIKRFLEEPNTYGWDVKKKLVWLGTHSYFFRLHFLIYLSGQKEGVDKNGASIECIDNFVNLQTTGWSGLGIIDVLPEILNISNKQRKDIRDWCERHDACFKILSKKGKEMIVKNIVNGQRYTIMFGGGKNPFQINHCVFGRLVFYNGYWYWSGQQKNFGELSKEQEYDIKQNFLKTAALITYRYDDKLALKAREMVKKRCNEFVEYFENDLAIFSDGLSMASELQKRDRKQFDALPEKKRSAILKKHKLQNPFPSFSLPQDLLEDDSGVAVFFNPDEGEEIMRNFNNVKNGFEKKGENLNLDEQDAIRIFMESEAICPKFIQRMTDDYGDESILSSYLMSGNEDGKCLDYLLRRFKGHFYRKRYPEISFV